MEKQSVFVGCRMSSHLVDFMKSKASSRGLTFSSYLRSVLLASLGSDLDKFIQDSSLKDLTVYDLYLSMWDSWRSGLHLVEFGGAVLPLDLPPGVDPDMTKQEFVDLCLSVYGRSLDRWAV